MKKVKLFCFLFLLFVFFAVSTFPIKASLVAVDDQGKVTIKVLSSEDSIGLEVPQKDSLEVKDVASGGADPNSKISLLRENGQIKLNVIGASGEKSLDVTGYSEEVIEIEERPQVERLLIGISGDKFTIEQKGVVAETNLAINVEPNSAGLTLETPSGFRYLSILPRQAADIVLRSKYINRITNDRRLVLNEDNQELTYLVEGDKVINLFNVFEYSTPVKAKVSASTGEILSVEQPTWLKLAGFLFV